ncbi:MAG: TonB-dependent receptor [Prevotellaceae bacterium]|jgi:TonB-linked SusC/RagA family outer membrane protein|nr:TonB-dependent receptor [Prevotellaceae bacterium]
MKRKQSNEIREGLRRVLLIAGLVCCGIAPRAQNVVTGTVSDEGGGLSGATVVVKGTNVGVLTGGDGTYSVSVPDNNSTLVFSMLGFVTREVAVGGRTVVDVELKEDVEEIDEVVVVGYGTQKKVNVTGSVSTVSGDELSRRPVSNPAAMLQGLVPGLSVVQGTGQPGDEGLSLRVRGQGTYSSAGSDPLVIVDGVPGSLSTLNANDIESISVLKDASSASIYGARAANGVIMVTTKSGKDNRFRLAYDVNVGIHTPVTLPKLVTNSAQYMRLFNEAKRNSGIASESNTYSEEMIALYENAADRVKYPNFDWLDYAINPATVQQHNLSLSGGAKGTSYSVSAGYIDQPGTLTGYGFKKYNFRANLRSQLKEWLAIGTNVMLERGDVVSTPQGQSDAFISLLAQAPTYSPFLPDGRYAYKAYPFESNNKNQAAIAESGVSRNRINYDANAQLWVEIKPAKGLTWHTKGAVNYNNYATKDWRTNVPLYWFHTGEFAQNLDVGTVGLTVTNERTFYTNLHSYLKYETLIAERHSVSVQAGYSQEANRYDNLQGYRQKFNFPLTELNAGATDNQSATGYANEWAMQSFFGRLNYDYMGRYLFEANIRRDGTSRIARETRWGTFPSFSAGWRLSEESFLKPATSEWLNNLKLRVSYGLLGNQNIGLYPYQAIIASTGNYPFDNSSLSSGYAQTAYANRNIKWESTSVFDFGVDITVFDGLSVTYEYYKKHTTDILRSAQTSALLGLSAPTVNAGAMINYGHEITANYAGVVKGGALKGLRYGLNVYLNTSRNEAANFGSEEIDGYYIRRNGLPYNSYYILEQIGVFQTQEEIDSSPKQFSDNVKPGDLKYRDVNGDNRVDNNDRIVVDGKFPKLEYSFGASASWKGFDLSLFFQGVGGRKVMVNDHGYNPFRQGTPPTVEWLTDRWTGPGTSSALPRITFNNEGNSQNTRNSTWFLQDASYLRLKNLVAGYTLPAHISSLVGSEKIRFYVSCDNLLTITRFKQGFDPERSGDGRFAVYPQNRIVSFGLNVEF